jgi:hypothetical protein
VANVVPGSVGSLRFDASGGLFTTEHTLIFRILPLISGANARHDPVGT